MKLIDADALRKVYIGEHIFRDGVVLDEEEQIIEAATRPMLAALDAAPTIGCETCEYHEDASCLHSGMVTYSPDGSEGFGFKPDPDFGCSLYEPKEQT